MSIQPSTLNATNHAGRSGLHLAAATGNMEIVVLLCTKNAEIDPLMLSDVYFISISLLLMQMLKVFLYSLNLREGVDHK